eukprot:489513_1
MDSKKDTDDSESDSTILVRVHINKEFLKRENLDCTQDVWKLAELEHDAIQLDCLRDDIPNAFRRARSFKPLFRSNEYQMKFYSYDPQKAEIEIEDDDDLQNELECCGLNLSGNSDSDDITSENKYLKLRVVFEQTSASSELQSPKLRLTCISLNSEQIFETMFKTESRIRGCAAMSLNTELQAPQLRLKRMTHYFLEEEQQNASRIAISAELEWIVPRDTLQKYPSAATTFTFHIKENLKFQAHEYVSRIRGTTRGVLSPLDVNEEYEFQ